MHVLEEGNNNKRTTKFQSQWVSEKAFFKNSGEYMTKSPSNAIVAYGSIFNKILLKFYKLF